MLDPPAQIVEGEADADTAIDEPTETVIDADPEHPLEFVPVTE